MIMLNLEQAIVGGLLFLLPVVLFLWAKDRYFFRKEIDFLHERERNMTEYHRRSIDVANTRADVNMDKIEQLTIAFNAVYKLMKATKKSQGGR